MINSDAQSAQKQVEVEKPDEKYSAPRLLPPIPDSYQPAKAITKIPATSSLEDILAILERDGGVILTDFVSLQELDKIDEELEPYTKSSIADDDSYNNFIGKKTLVIPGLVGKSDTIANILDTNETIDKLLKVILEERYPAVFEQHTEELVVDPLLSICMGFHVGHGSPRQALHRDDMIFSSKHRPDMKINEVDGFSCFLAGTRITRENGGTMVILGSHKWEHDRRGRPDEVSFLEMERGSAFIFLSTLAHGAGYNTIPGEVRKITNLVFCRGTLRTEENQFLCVPRSKVLKMSPKMQTLLGFKKPAGSWLGMVENEDPAKDLEAIYERMLK
ncbi:phytanoyl-CoA dioxygenase [Metarhizium guizhouense ARSEF 977]|uniref:Phytanoyl-CoA dioxygenase n=1 Tax=Metarhizium guizhouense (strain ARSEF 977) TaxID=1276136 RepID=A0A0B4HVS7_METGA|nr:phytanoyl-CoA dioxygenase [Metarhizium guizhouense ARSEF 977]